MSTACQHRLSFVTLVDYWLGDLPRTEQDALEAQVFDCASCHARLEEVAALGEAIGTLARRGDITSVLTPKFLERIKARGAVVREYRIAPGGSVECSVAPHEDFAIAHLQASLGDVSRLDLVFDLAAGGLEPRRLEDVAFDSLSGEIVLAPRVSDLRQLGPVLQRVRLLSVTPTGDQLLGEYYFRHSPHSPA